ncbi:hypothetical protein SO802_020431 [Lithocarpus litseifolius]|uniref:Uncharacterized protein n=1 Tax=Lithocarpus litseifolius TaxID=425828 RepID=A0AAW2CH77_9ROSI
MGLVLIAVGRHGFGSVHQRDGSSELNSIGNVDQKHVHQLVILPLLRAEGLRCSVKPASRCALHSRETTRPRPSRKSHGPALNLERASQDFALTDPAQ